MHYNIIITYKNFELVNYKYDKESWYVLKAYVVVYESNLTMKLFDKNEGLIKP